MNTFESLMGEYKLKVENELEAFFDNKQNNSNRFGLFSESNLLKLREFTLREAKRIRPVLVVIGARAFRKFSKPEERELVRAAIAIELAQSFFLIHDDIIDGSAKRRGKSSMHSSYDDLEEGKKQAICVGDIAYTYSIQAIQKLNFKEEIVLRFLKKFTELIETTCHGEMLDIKYEKKSVLELSEKDIIDCISLKTANYTIAGPLQLGAIVSEIPDSDKNMKLLYDFGMKLGCAFQVQDDILGLIGTEAEIGKPVTSDFSEGKKTLLMKNVFQMLPSGEEKNQLMFKFGKKISPRDYEKIRKIIKQSGAVEKTELFAKNLMLQAKEILEKIAINPKEKKFLKEMADYVIERSK